MAEIYPDQKAVLKIPLVSETRNLYQYFMLSEDDVYILNKCYIKLAEGIDVGINIDKLLQYLELPINSFYENVLNYLHGEMFFVNYYMFSKFVLLLSFLSTISLILNFYYYFDNDSNDSDKPPTHYFIQLFPRDLIPQKFEFLVESDLQMYQNDFRNLMISKQTNSNYFFIFNSVKELISRVQTKFLGSRTIESIRYRYCNYQLFYTYFIKTKQFPKLPLCKRLYNFLLHLPDEYHFDYYMKPDKQDIYQLPFLFSPVSMTLRSGSSITRQSYTSTHKSRSSYGSQQCSNNDAKKQPNYIFNDVRSNNIKSPIYTSKIQKSKLNIRRSSVKSMVYNRTKVLNDKKESHL